MPGTRYTDWTHVHVVGERARAMAYLPFARKVLGHVVQDAGYLQLQTHQLTKRLNDGTVIVAELRGGIPRVTIHPSPRDAKQSPLPGRDRFVVWARDVGRPDGIDVTHPQQILEATKERERAGGLSFTGSRPQWQTQFYDAGIEGYDGFTLNKDVYRSIKGRQAFPTGLRHAGNVDWCSRTGYRIAWYGPSTRMFTDPYIQPQKQFGKFVFMLGEALLDVEAYITDSVDQPAFAERYVMGAALRTINGARWLYTVQADLPVMTTPSAQVPAFTIYFSEPYPLGSIPLVVSRYRLAVVDSDTEVSRLLVLSNSREVLWSGGLERACQPWHFNLDGTVASSFAPPAAIAATVQDAELLSAPGTTDTRYTFDLADDSALLSTISVGLPAGGGGTATLGRDFDADGPVDLLLTRDAAGVLSIAMRSASWPLHVRTSLAGNVTRVQRRWLLHADLTERALLFVLEDYTYDEVAILGGSVNVEFWRDGSRVAQLPAGAQQYLATGLPNYSDVLLEPVNDLYGALLPAAIAPSFALYGLVALPGIAAFGVWAGGHGLYAYLAHPADHIYGSYAVTTNSPEAPLPISGLRDGGFTGDRVDVDAHYSTLGCATFDGVSVFSCPPFQPGSNASLHWADDGTLPDLTGVTGAQSRFHPIWRLGRFDLPTA